MALGWGEIDIHTEGMNKIMRSARKFMAELSPYAPDGAEPSDEWKEIVSEEIGEINYEA
jgi:hypothetical protein